MVTGPIAERGNGIIVTIMLGRNICGIILVTYLPTLLMNIINQATNYITTTIKYDVIITVNITCMMVLASVYLSVSNSLPETASIKPVEIWLLFNLAYPFMVIIINIGLQVMIIFFMFRNVKSQGKSHGKYWGVEFMLVNSFYC